MKENRNDAFDFHWLLQIYVQLLKRAKNNTIAYIPGRPHRQFECSIQLIVFHFTSFPPGKNNALLDKRLNVFHQLIDINSKFWHSPFTIYHLSLHICPLNYKKVNEGEEKPHHLQRVWKINDFIIAKIVTFKTKINHGWWTTTSTTKKIAQQQQHKLQIDNLTAVNVHYIRCERGRGKNLINVSTRWAIETKLCA